MNIYYIEATSKSTHNLNKIIVTSTITKAEEVAIHQLTAQGHDEIEVLKIEKQYEHLQIIIDPNLISSK